MSKWSSFEWTSLVVALVGLAVAIYFGVVSLTGDTSIQASGGSAVSTGSGAAVVTGDNTSVNIRGTQTNQGSNND
ncbi:MAG: hypothetical protein AAFN27_02840 [Pseudomonadota bacterium]